jgi:hypothetical protein
VLFVRADGLDHGKILGPHIIPGGILDAFLGNDDHVKGQSQQFFVPSKQLSDSSSDPVSLNGIADFFAGDDGHSGIGQAIWKINQVEILSSG